jgi:DNA-binding NarL/FixJ family response regulator
VRGGEALANKLLLSISDRNRVIFASAAESGDQQGNIMLSLSQVKITPRDEQVLQLLMQGCSNKEIASQLNISPRTVKQHLRTLFLRAGIRDGRKRVKLATAMFLKEQMKSCNPANG